MTSRGAKNFNRKRDQTEEVKQGKLEHLQAIGKEIELQGQLQEIELRGASGRRLPAEAGQDSLR